MMRTLAKTPLVAVTLAALLLPVSAFTEDDEQLMTIPAAISEPKASSTASTASVPPSETLIGLPSEDAMNHPPEPPKKQVEPETLIPLPQEEQEADKSTASPSITPSDGSDQSPIEIPTPAGNAEIVVSGQAPAPAEQPGSAAKSDLPVFPKDTSSAIFMVMKTWECDDYDGRTLLEHSIGVYAKESEDAFSIRGLDVLPPFKVTLKESDITLDELLDVVSQKAKIDWGVDIDQKVIFLYPAHTQ